MATTQQNIIKRFMNSLDLNGITSGKESLNQAIAYASGGYFTDATTAINKMLKELSTYGATNFLANRCGIILNNSDTGAITGSDAGGGSTKTATSIVPESGKLDTSFNDKSFTTEDGLTIRLYKTPTTNDEKYMWRALKTWWAEESLNLIKDSYGYSFADNDATVKDLTIRFKKDTKSTNIAYTDYPQTINGHYTRLLQINTRYYSGFASGDVNGKSSNNPCYLDRTLAHEFTHVVMMSKVNSYKSLPQFITEGLGELTHGIDDLRKDVIKTLVNNPTKLKSSLKMTSGTGAANSYAGGYIFLRWFAKQAALNYSSGNKSMTLKTGKLIFGDDEANSIVGGTGNDTIFGVAGNDTLNGGAGKDILWGEYDDDLLFGGTANDTLNGGAGDDTLHAGTGDDMLTGGAGNDVFVYTAGKDTITDYAAGDKISLNVANISRTTVSGSNVVFTVGKSKLTVKDAKGETITLLDTSGKEYSTIVGGTTLVVSDVTSSPVKANSEAKLIDASERTKAVKITGNKLDNTIIGGSGNDSLHGGNGDDSIVSGSGNNKLYGNAGNDTLIGGTGADTLSGDAGNDKLLGGAGNDLLNGSAGVDTLSGDDGNDKLFGGAGNDLLNGGAGNDTLSGEAGNDRLFGGAGNDSITGGAGADTLSGDDGNDILLGEAGNDSITGGEGNDCIKGGKGNDSLWGGAGNDSLWGDAGADKFIYSSGDDIIFGFDSKDTLTLDNLTFSTVYDKKNKAVTLTFDDGSLTLKNFTASTFHIDNSTYKISGSKFVKK